MADTGTRRPVAILPTEGDTPLTFGIVTDEPGPSTLVQTQDGLVAYPPEDLDPLDRTHAAAFGLSVIEVNHDVVVCHGIGPVFFPTVPGSHQAVVVRLSPVGLSQERVGLCPVCWRYFVKNPNQEVERAGLPDGEAGDG